MTYRVIVTPAAENDLRTAYRYIRRQAPAQRAIGSGAHAKPQRVLRTTPSAAPWLRKRILRSAHPRLFFGSGNRGIYRFLFVVFAEENP